MKEALRPKYGHIIRIARGLTLVLLKDPSAAGRSKTVLVGMLDHPVAPPPVTIIKK